MDKKNDTLKMLPNDRQDVLAGLDLYKSTWNLRLTTKIRAPLKAIIVDVLDSIYISPGITFIHTLPDGRQNPANVVKNTFHF